MPAKHLVMSIGLPFSGKSTLADEYAARGYQIISRDDLLAEIIASDEFKKEESLIKERHTEPTQAKELFAARNELAIQFLNHKLAETIKTGNAENIFYGGTNLQKKTRQGVFALKHESVTVDGIYLKTPLEEIIRRARADYESKKRTDSFNQEAFNEGTFLKMVQLFEEPTAEEGFDNLEIREWRPPQEQNTELKKGFK